MAYDVTALTNAIAQGRVDEAKARELINRSRDLEIDIAKLLDGPAPETQAAAPETQAENPVQ